MDSEQWLHAYESSAFAQVQGWTHPGALSLVNAVDQCQKRLGVHGGVMEIGVFHGLFFMALNGVVDDPSVQSIAVDLFEAQHLNIDGSGRGSETIFRENLLVHDRHGGRNVVIIAADSSTLKGSDVLSRVNSGPRIVSIDGGHTAAHTIADLELALEVMASDGVVFVDDILNAHWLGVIEGVVTYLDHRPVLWPLAIGYNKLLMCRMSMHATYRELLTGTVSWRKTTQLCGHDVLAV